MSFCKIKNKVIEGSSKKVNKIFQKRNSKDWSLFQPLCRKQKIHFLSCRIFEHFALQTNPVIEFIKLKSALCKEGTLLAPKLADPLSF
jgi:hypothetical protein